jgi:hypothetical protein
MTEVVAQVAVELQEIKQALSKRLLELLTLEVAVVVLIVVLQPLVVQVL